MNINVSKSDILQNIQDSLLQKKPFLLTRYGEGESRIFERNDDSGGTKWIIKNLIGYVPDKIEDVVEEMELALVNSDIIGIPREIDCLKHILFKNINGHIRRIFEKKEINENLFKYCSIDIPTKFDFETLLNSMDEVTILTCRDVSELMKSHFKIKNIKWFKIPPEYKYEHDKKNISWNFYPEVHHSIRDEFLSQDNRGKLLLYGAGALGKDLGYYFKKSGGVAFDIGSIFDHWYGKKTRGPEKGTDSYGESPLKVK